jgi:hypothetical protein
MGETSFDQVITEHLTLSERNKRLEQTMPLDRYREQNGSGSPPEEEGPPIELKAPPHADPDSWWDTKDGECPPPPLGWDAD